MPNILFLIGQLLASPWVWAMGAAISLVLVGLALGLLGLYYRELG